MTIIRNLGICDYFTPSATGPDPDLSADYEIWIDGRTDLLLHKARTYTAQIQTVTGNPEKSDCDMESFRFRRSNSCHAGWQYCPITG